MCERDLTFERERKRGGVYSVWLMMEELEEEIVT